MLSSTGAEIAGPPAADFKLLTNHGQALLLITHDPRARMRDIAALLNITERAAQRIVADLVRAGYVHRERDGRERTRCFFGQSSLATQALAYEDNVVVAAATSSYAWRRRSAAA